MRISVGPDAFVSPQGPYIEPFQDVFLLRIGLTPAEHPDARRIADACRAGGVAILNVKGTDSPPFVVSKVTNDADAIVVTATQDAAFAILRDLRFQGFGDIRVVPQH